MILISVSTLAGAWIARRESTRLAIRLAIASAMMMIIALTDLLPGAWQDAVETGVPLWVVGIAVALAFRSSPTSPAKDARAHPTQAERLPARTLPGRDRRLKEAVSAALFGSTGNRRRALTVHRAIEGATLALTASAVVVIALMVHSASEGLALAALLDMAGRRLAPWLVVACVSPAVGVLVATFGSLPGQVVPAPLGMVTGVLLRTAMVGLKLAAGRQENGRLSRGQLVIATTVAITMGVLLAMAH